MTTKAKTPKAPRPDYFATIGEWGPEARGYSLRIVREGDGGLRPSLYVVDVEYTETTPAVFVGAALIDVRGDAKAITYFAALTPELKALLNKSRFIGHNVKSDLHAFNSWGCNITADQIYGDTMIQAYCINSTEEEYGLKALALSKLGYSYPSYREIVGSGKKKATLDAQPARLVAAYCGMDTAATYELYKRFGKATNGQRRYYHSLELPTLRALFSIEQRGATLDVHYFNGLHEDFTTRANGALAELRRTLGDDFNPASPKQVKEVLFKAAGIDEEKTDIKALKKHENNSFVKALLEYRDYAKLAGTYTGAFLALPTLPRVHAKFNQVAVSADESTRGIRTGRLSSSDPNLQNIPARKPMGARIRQGFTAPDGCRLVVADYSQIELRLLAHYSGEPKLIEAFLSGADVHAETAAIVFGAPHTEEEAKANRNIAKTINFGLLYGMGTKKLAFTIGKSEEEADAILKAYWEKLPGIKAWINKTHAAAYLNGGVQTMLGRFIPLPALKSLDPYERWGAERAAVNYIIQGSAAEIMKLALIRVEQAGLRTILTVHDELVQEVRPDELEIAKTKMAGIMRNVVRLKVPLDVSIGSGSNWREAK